MQVANPETAENDGAKRKRGDTPEGTVVWRLVTSTHTKIESAGLAPPPTPTRRFHVSRAAGNVVLFERSASEQDKAIPKDGADKAQIPEEGTLQHKIRAPVSKAPSTPRKRPGAGAALAPTQKTRTAANGISEETLRQFEKFSAEVENDAVSPRRSPVRSPTSPPARLTPRAPKLRFKDRHPAEAARLEAQDADAMDIDDPSNPYVYDTYVREIVKPDANGHVPLPSPQTTSIGYIILTADDEEWWYESDSSDREFETDDDDENAEDYYANDYPEDELSDDDEFDRDPYRHYKDENDETYDLEGDGSDVEGEEFSTAVPKMKGAYWGKVGEE